MNARVFEAATLAPGSAEGAPLKLNEPLSFWGGLDPRSGLIIDRAHPQAGASVAGRVLMMAAGRGSSSGSASLTEAVRLGFGPAAILLLRRDAIVAVGALVAAELYGKACPVALVDERDWDELAAASLVSVVAGAEGAKISPLVIPAKAGIQSDGLVGFKAGFLLSRE